MKKAFRSLLGLALVACAQLAMAAWPTKPVTVIVPFPPGGSTDNIARVMAGKLQQQLGQPFVVDNRPGATGTIGTGQLKRAAPDGYTLMVSSLAPFVVAPHMMKNLPYNVSKDLDLITVAVQAPNVLVVPEASPYKSVADVINALKKSPDKVTFASSGNGSSDHLTAALFWQVTGTSGVHIPYKGGAPAVSDLLGNQVNASFQNINAVIQHINSGKLRALAVTGGKRSALLPQVPTLSESGVKGADVYSWQAVAAPKGLPADVKATLYQAIVKALNDPEVKPKLTEVGFEIVGSTPEEFTRFQQEEDARWQRVIETAHITAD